MSEEERIARVVKTVKYAFFGLIVLILVFGSFGTISAGERGVKTRVGKVVGTVEPGLYFKVPLTEKVHKMSVKTQTVIYEKENPLTSASKDLQDVQIATVVNYHVDPTKVEEIFIQYGSVESFEERAIRPVVRDTVKAVSAQYTAEELITKRAQLADDTIKKLNERLLEKNVIVEQGNITNVQFSASFSEAIERKVTAVQNAEAAKNLLEQKKFEAEQTVVTAKAVAEAQRIQSAALEAQGGREYVNLEAVKKWDGHLPEQMIPGAALPFINLAK
jgi:prohibitin 2